MNEYRRLWNAVAAVGAFRLLEEQEFLLYYVDLLRGPSLRGS